MTTGPGTTHYVHLPGEEPPGRTHRKDSELSEYAAKDSTAPLQADEVDSLLDAALGGRSPQPVAAVIRLVVDDDLRESELCWLMEGDLDVETAVRSMQRPTCGICGALVHPDFAYDPVPRHWVHPDCFAYTHASDLTDGKTPSRELVPGQRLVHTCGSPMCVYPEHLVAVFDAGNAEDGRA